METLETVEYVTPGTSSYEVGSPWTVDLRDQVQCLGRLSPLRLCTCDPRSRFCEGSPWILWTCDASISFW